MRRILYFNPMERIGGSELSLLELLARLDRKRYEPVVIAPDEGAFLDAVRKLNIETRVVHFPQSFKKTDKRAWSPGSLKNVAWMWQVPSVINSVIKVIRNEKIDLVHTNGIKAHFLGGAAARLDRCPVVWHIREHLYPGKITGYLKKLSREWPSKIICNSNFTASGFPDESPVTVVYNGVDTKKFKPTDTRYQVCNRFGISSDSLIVAMAGHFAPVKGQEQFIRMVALLKTEYPDIKGVIAGEEAYFSTGDYEAKLKSLTAELGVENEVVFAGFIGELQNLMNASDVFVVPSLMEGFGRVALEATACGVPVVSTKAGGLAEIILHEKTGLSVEPGSPEALTDGVKRILNNREYGRELGLAGRNRAEEVFSLDRMAVSVQNVYEEVLKSESFT